MRDIVIDTYVIMYKFYRTLRRSDPTEKAMAYAGEFSAYFLALLVFDFLLVPAGLLLAYLQIPFTVTRYFLLACLLVAIYFSKKRTTVMLETLSTEDPVLLERFSTLSKGRWLAWLLYIAASILFALAGGYFYSIIARLK